MLSKRLLKTVLGFIIYLIVLIWPFIFSPHLSIWQFPLSESQMHP